MNCPLMDVARRAQPGIAAPGAGLSSRWKPDGSGLEPGSSGGHRIVSKLLETVSVLDIISPALHGGIVLGANTVDLKPYLDQAFALSGCFVRVPRGRYLSTDLENLPAPPSSKVGENYATLQAMPGGRDISTARGRVQHASRFPRAGEQHAGRDRRAHSATRLPTRARSVWTCVSAASLARARDGHAVKLIALLLMATLAGCTVPVFRNCASVKVERYGMEYDVYATDCRLPTRTAVPL